MTAIPEIIKVTVPHIAPIITSLAALVAALAAVKGTQAKRHRNAQQIELIQKLDAAQQQRDRIATELADEQRKCREEATLLRDEIEKHNNVTAELLKMAR